MSDVQHQPRPWSVPDKLAWHPVPLRYLLQRVARRGHEGEELLSVYRDHGVVPKASRSDNFNKPGKDLDAYLLVTPGDLVINKMKAWQGSLAVSHYRGLVSPAYFCFTVSDRILGGYLHHLLRSHFYMLEWARLSSGVRPNQWDLDVGAFLGTEVALPPLATQRAIASFLDRKTAAIDALIEKKERLIALLEEKRQALITQAVTKGLDPSVPMKDSGIEWLGEIPAHWSTLKLRYVAAKLQGRIMVQPHLYFADDGVPIVFGYNIKNRTIDEAGLSRVSFDADRAHAHARVRAGDLLTVRLGSPGMTVVVPPSLDGAHFASIMWVHQHARANSEWLCHVMNSTIVQRQLAAANYGATLSQFNITDAADWLLPFPEAAEQRLIAEWLSDALRAVDRVGTPIAAQLNLLREYRQALITAAVTGQLDIPPEPCADREAHP